MTTLGTRLKAARTAKGYGLREVAKLSGVSASNISRAERGGNMYAESLIALAKCYGVSVDELAGHVPYQPIEDEAERNLWRRLAQLLVGYDYQIEKTEGHLTELKETRDAIKFALDNWGKKESAP